MARATIAAGFPKALLDFAVSQGAPKGRLLARAGLGAEDLADQDRRVPLERYIALMDAAVDLCDDPALALKYGENVPMEMITIVGLIGQTVATVGEAREHINRYAALMLDADERDARGVVQIVRDAEGVWLQHADPIYIDHPRLIEASFARSICGARRLLGGTLYFARHAFPRSLHFRHEAPSYRAEYERIFSAPIVFGSRRNAIQVDEEFLSIRLPSANRYVFGIFSDRAEALLGELEASRTLRGRVERELIPILHKGDVGVTVIADRLALSRQTLHRRLRAEGTTFTQVLDDLRRRMALDYLAGGKVSVSETAYLVGFSEPAAFSRAFKRWTGQAPSAARKRA